MQVINEVLLRTTQGGATSSPIFGGPNEPGTISNPTTIFNPQFPVDVNGKPEV